MSVTVCNRSSWVVCGPIPTVLAYRILQRLSHISTSKCHQTCSSSATRLNETLGNGFKQPDLDPLVTLEPRKPAPTPESIDCHFSEQQQPPQYPISPPPYTQMPPKLVLPGRRGVVVWVYTSSTSSPADLLLCVINLGSQHLRNFALLLYSVCTVTRTCRINVTDYISMAQDTHQPYKFLQQHMSVALVFSPSCGMSDTQARCFI